MRKLIVVLLLFLSLLISASAQNVPDGFYLVVSDQVGSVEVSRTVLWHDPLFSGQTEGQEVVVDTDYFVPIVLKEAPTKTPDRTERTQFWLQIQLTEQSATQFEHFTRKHLGETVAIVVGGKVVTMHRIKGVIEGGKVQISRCGDQGCQVLFRELQDNISTDGS